jgi:hypothetical protein
VSSSCCCGAWRQEGMATAVFWFTHSQLDEGSGVFACVL